MGVAVHEMLHRIGQRHEHTRSDRDRYVQIRWDRIDQKDQYNYHRRLTYNRNPYDIGSIMQYVSILLQDYFFVLHSNIKVIITLIS